MRGCQEPVKALVEVSFLLPMINLDSNKVKEFQALYERCFGMPISSEEALDRGNNLIRLIQIIHPVTNYRSKLIDHENRKNN